MYFINDTNKVFHLQICDSLLIHKGQDPWHTLYIWVVMQPISDTLFSSFFSRRESLSRLNYDRGFQPPNIMFQNGITLQISRDHQNLNSFLWNFRWFGWKWQFFKVRQYWYPWNKINLDIGGQIGDRKIRVLRMVEVKYDCLAKCHFSQIFLHQSHYRLMAAFLFARLN